MTAPEIYPKVTAAILTWNAESKIAAAISDFRAQDYPNLEILVQDDRSSDNTLAAAQAAAGADARVTITVNPENLGAWYNFRRAVERSNADYIVWACPGDSWNPTYISRLVARLSEVPNALAAQCSITHVDETTRQPIETMYFRGPLIPDLLPSNRLAREVLIKPRGPNEPRPHYSEIGHGLLKREAILAALQSYDGIGTILNERLLLCQFALTGRIVSIPDVLYRRERHTVASTVRAPNDPSRRANMEKRFFIPRAGWRLLRTILRSKLVSTRKKIFAPWLAFYYLAYNYGHMARIGMVGLAQALLPRQLYEATRNICARLR